MTMVGGLIVSQLLTLFTTPVIYLGFARMAQRWRERRGVKRATRDAEERRGPDAPQIADPAGPIGPVGPIAPAGPVGSPGPGGDLR